MLHTDGPEIYLVLDQACLCLDVCPSMTVAYHETDDSWGRGGLSYSTSCNRTRPPKMKPTESSLTQTLPQLGQTRDNFHTEFISRDTTMQPQYPATLGPTYCTVQPRPRELPRVPQVHTTSDNDLGSYLSASRV